MNINWKNSFGIDDLAILHEAGHASVAIALGFPTVKVRLVRRDKSGKLLDPGTTVDGYWTDTENVLPKDAIAYLLAGMASEKLFIQDQNLFPDSAYRESLVKLHRKECENRSRGDISSSIEHGRANELQISESNIYDSEFLREALRLLETNYDKTIAIYRELCESGEFCWSQNS